MKKYIFFSVLLHVGIGTALIHWSGISISEWTQNLLNKLGIERITDGTADMPGEFLEEEPSPQLQIKKPAVVQKPKAPPIPVVEKPVESTVKQMEKKPSDSKVIEGPSEETAQTESVNNQEVQQETEPAVKYNPAEDFAIQQENSAPPENLEPPDTEEENSPESVSDNEIKTELIEENTSEFVSNREFEEINTDPQELKKIINDSPLQRKFKSSQTLVPVPGNPKWIYPQQARNNKNEGSVFLQYFVDDTGFVDKIQLLQSSGYSILDNEALRVMARQRYQPGQSGWYKHRVDFKLKNM